MPRGSGVAATRSQAKLKGSAEAKLKRKAEAIDEDQLNSGEQAGETAYEALLRKVNECKKKVEMEVKQLKKKIGKGKGTKKLTEQQGSAEAENSNLAKASFQEGEGVIEMEVEDATVQNEFPNPSEDEDDLSDGELEAVNNNATIAVQQSVQGQLSLLGSATITSQQAE